MPEHTTDDGHEVTLTRFITKRWLNLFLLAGPVSWVIHVLGWSETWLFVTSAVAIIPLAGLIGQATEELANRTGPYTGAMLNATFGNATELIIALFALRAGLNDVVKASISGSILGNILLVLGVGMFAGGLRHGRQRFSHSGTNAVMLFLAVTALVMPAVYDLTVYGSIDIRSTRVEILSLFVAGVLLLSYIVTMILSYVKKTHVSMTEEIKHKPRLELRQAMGLLAGATILAAWQSELLVEGVSAAQESLGLTEFFIGVVIVAIVGNAAEHFSAVTMAMQNRMEIAVTIANASSIQIALLIAPVLVFASLLFGHPLSLVFNAFEVVGLFLAVIAVAIVSLDGESTWAEGLQLVAVYLVLVVVFYFVPAG